VAIAEAGVMKRELGLLNIICVLAALVFIGLALVNALTSGEFLTTDNLFITMVCLVMALMFAVNPLLYLKSEGKLPIPLLNKAPDSIAKLPGSTAQTVPGARGIKPPAPPVLLDAKGRPVPHDVRQIVSTFGQLPAKDN
jgi:hypothetical protein